MHRQALINSALFCAQEDLRGRICRFFASTRPCADEKARGEVAWMHFLQSRQALFVDKDLWCRCVEVHFFFEVFTAFRDWLAQ